MMQDFLPDGPIPGLIPVIIDVQPVTNFPALIGLITPDPALPVEKYAIKRPI